MAVYVPTNWQDFPNLSTAITAARLNNIEAGVVAAYIQGTGTLVNADLAAGAAIAISKFAGYPADATKFLTGAGTWVVPAAVVASVFGRTGAVVSAANDYSYSQLSGNPVVGEATSLPGSPVNGQVVQLRIGTTPFQFVRMVFDSTWAHWVSEEHFVTHSSGTNSGATLDQFGTSGSNQQTLILRYRELKAAGLTLQIRAVAIASAVGPVTGTMLPEWQTCDVGGALSGWTTLAGTTFTSTTSTAIDSGWQSVGAAAADLIQCSAQMSTSGGQWALASASMAYRWIS